MIKRAEVIRFGVLCQGPQLSVWESQVLEAVLLLGHTSLEVLLHTELPAAEAASTTRASTSLAWRFYRKWLYRPVALRRAPATAARNTPRLACTTQSLRGELGLDESTRAAVSKCQLDFIVSFVAQPTGRLFAGLAQLGVWGFQFGSWQNTAEVPISFWEVYTSQLTSYAALYRMTGSEECDVLQEGVFRTLLHSPTHSAAAMYKECANWPADICRGVMQGGELKRTGRQLAPPIVDFQPPANAALLAFLGRLSGRKLRQLYETYLQADQWNMGVVNRPIQDFLRPDSLRDAHVDAPPLPDRNVFYADSFARQEENKTVVYFEFYDYRVRRGNISRLSYPWQAGEVPAPVLSFPHHLSYPFLHGPYCMPEAWVTNSIRLYDLRAPVTDHTAGQLLLEAPAVDSTLLEYQGRHWLFYARMDRDPMLNLFIAYADTLEGPWHEHPQNPVKTTIRSARPGGPFFEHAGKLYRPAQDCAQDYGYGITINQVLTLTPTEYAEQEVAALTSPHPGYPDGLHTIAAVDEASTLIDFKRRRFIPFATLLALWITVSGVIPFKRKRR
ncbi:hypothetical protein MTX78_00530 [Hymenobacter tibetensis]|uniref:Glucosamine inositolphosphorylceramide transferase 1 N-terminal domain-containing protein n=1 Tax=Hymenobacter tibetensis TaxID=497967 RepID=A0ABY4D552_9BACT|nr:hypothetical protein [Hymenobacter tibetensis]UOG75098.1 hypothetical protein MTX78_00530 [Hymenobacter tibetensis]